MHEIQRETEIEIATPRAGAAVQVWLREWWAALVVCIPVAVSALRAALGDWVPNGDDAYFTVRSRDVLTEHHPLLGAWSSGSVDLERPINNLGPIQLDLLAPFTRWTPIGGTAIGVAAVNIAAIVAIAWTVRRAAGERAVLPAMLAVGLLTWTMGSEMLITPRQHQYSILPFLCLLVASWAVAGGDRWALPIAVGAGSLVAQTHLSYPVLVAALAAVIVGGQMVTTRDGTAIGGRRPVVISGLLLALLWSQTIIDQLVGDGNLGDVLSGSGNAGRVGIADGSRIVARALLSTDMLVRPGYRRFDAAAQLASPVRSTLFWALLIVVGTATVRAVARLGWRRAVGPVVGVVAVVAGVVDAALLPRTRFGLQIANYRWLWSIGAFLALLAFVTLDRRFGRHRPAPRFVAGTCVVVLAAVNLPRSVQHVNADRYLAEQRGVASMLDELDRALDTVDGPVVVDDSEMYFGHGFTYPLLVELQEHGIDFRFDDPIQARRFGDGRVSDGTERHRLRLVAGDRALTAGESADVLAFVDGERPVALVVDRA